MAARRVVRTSLKWLISLGIGAAFVYLSMSDWHAEEILAGGLRIENGRLMTDRWRVDLVAFPVYFLSLVVMHFFRAWRWRPLLKPLADVDFWTLNRVCSVGFMAVFILPMRVGELVRPVLLSTEAPVRRTAALATIVVERVVDGVMVAGFLAVALVFMPRTYAESFAEIRIGTYIALLLFGGLVVALVVLYVFRTQVSAVVRALMGRASGKWAHRLGGLTDRFLMGLSIFPDVKNFLWFLAGSFCYWCSNGIGLWILAIGFDLGQVGLLGSFAMMSTIVIGMMIPNAPANVGSFWYFLLKPCELYGVAPGDPAGLAYALTVWSMQLLQLLVFGGWFILRGKVSWRRAFAIGGTPVAEEPESPAAT